MENINNNEIDVKNAGKIIGFSYILFGITFLLFYGGAEEDISILIGIIAVIMFLTQRKYIKPEIKTYVYISIIIYALTIIIFAASLGAYVVGYASSLVSHVKNNTISGKYLVPVIKYAIEASIAVSFIYLFTYILTSIKFLGSKKYLFILFLFVATILEDLYSILFLNGFSKTIATETINISDISSFEQKIEYLGFGYPDILIRIFSVLIFVLLFLYLGIRIMRNPEDYIINN